MKKLIGLLGFRKNEYPRSDVDGLGIVEQSPVWIQSVTATIVVTTVLAIGWLASAQTEEVVIVQGRLEPEGLVKDIKPIVQGVVKEMLVKEGSKVSKGQLLIRLETQVGEKNVLTTRKTLEAKKEQLMLKKAEIRKTENLAFDRDKSLRGTLRLQEDVLARLDRLNKSGGIPELQYLSQKDKVQTSKAEISQNMLDLQRQLEILQQQAKTIESEIQQTEFQLKQALTTLTYQEIRSPVDGIVFDLGKEYAGSSIEPGRAIMKIVPPDSLVGKVEVPSDKIGFVRKGMSADVSIDSFPATDFGIIHGHVKQVGSDALPPDPSQNKPSYTFPATVLLDSQVLRLKNGNFANLASGMSIKANIRLRRVSYLSLIMQSLGDKVDSVRTR